MKTTKRTNTNDIYENLDGNRFSLTHLDAEGRRLVSRMRRRAATNPRWDDFRNYAINAVREFYVARGVPRSKFKGMTLFEIALDLCSRLGIAEGYIRPSDYRDELEEIIRDHFPSRSDFCKATGISPDMLSHVLAGRKDKDLSLEALSAALQRIGYRLKIVPAVVPTKQMG